MCYLKYASFFRISSLLILMTAPSSAELPDKKQRESKTFNIIRPASPREKTLIGKPLGRKKKLPQITSCNNAPQPCFNVKDFGAKGDGSADDTDAIQQTIDTAAAAASQAQRGTVFFPSGTYTISKRANSASLILRDNLLYVGETPTETPGLEGNSQSSIGNLISQEKGHLPSRLRLRDNQPRWTRMMTTLDSEAPALNITFQFLEFDGNEPSQPYQESGERNNIQNHLLFIVGAAGGPGASSENFVIQDCVFHDSAGSGIRFHGGNHKNVVITRNRIYNVREQSIEFIGSDFEISYNFIYDTLSVNGAQLGDSAIRGETGNALVESPKNNIKIFKNTIYNTRAGFFLDGAVGPEGSATLSNVEIYENNLEFDFPIQGGGYEYFAAIGLWGARNSVIRDNKIKGYPQVGIIIQSGENVQIHGNSVRNIRKIEGSSGSQNGGIFIMAVRATCSNPGSNPGGKCPLSPSQNILIKNNVVKDSERAGIRISDPGSSDYGLGVKDITLEKNLILNSKEDGLNISAAQSVQVLKNQIGFSNIGLFLNYSGVYGKDITFLKNYIYDSKQYSAYIGASAPQNISFGFSTPSGAPKNLANKTKVPPNIAIGNNCFMRNVSGLYKAGSQTVTAERNFWGCAGGPNTTGCDAIQLAEGAGAVTFNSWLPNCPAQ